MKRTNIITGFAVVLGLLAGSQAHATENMWKIFSGENHSMKAPVYKSTAAKEATPFYKEAGNKEAIIAKQEQEYVKEAPSADVEKESLTLMVKNEATGEVTVCSKELVEAKEKLTSEREKCLLAARDIVKANPTDNSFGSPVDLNNIGDACGAGSGMPTGRYRASAAGGETCAGIGGRLVACLCVEDGD